MANGYQSAIMLVFSLAFGWFALQVIQSFHSEVVYPRILIPLEAGVALRDGTFLALFQHCKDREDTWKRVQSMAAALNRGGAVPLIPVLRLDNIGDGANETKTIWTWGLICTLALIADITWEIIAARS